MSSLSMDSEQNTISVSEVVHHPPMDDEQLLQCDNLVDQEEVTSLTSQEDPEITSLLSGSWSCSMDSIVSAVVTSFDQDLYEVVKETCSSFLFPPETESVEEETLETTSNLQTLMIKVLPAPPEDTYSLATLSSIEDEFEDTHSVETLPSTDCEIEKRCYPIKEIKVHPAPIKYLDAVKSPMVDWSIFCASQEMTTTTSCSAPDLKPIEQEPVEPSGVDKKTKKSNRFFQFFVNIFSKTKKKKKLASEKKQSSGFFEFMICFHQDQPQPLA